MIPDKQLQLLPHPIFIQLSLFRDLFICICLIQLSCLNINIVRPCKCTWLPQYVWPQLDRQTDWLTFEAVGPLLRYSFQQPAKPLRRSCFLELIRINEGKPPIWKAVNCCQRVFGSGSPQHNYSFMCVYSMTHFGTFVFRVLNIFLWNFECVLVLVVHDSYLQQGPGKHIKRNLTPHLHK